MAHPLQVLQILQKARLLLTDPTNWMKGEYFVGFSSSDQFVPDNVCMCTVGAVAKAANDQPGRLHVHTNYAANQAADRIEEVLKARGEEGSIPDFNDASHTEHHHVLEVLDAAVNLQKGVALPYAAVSGLVIVSAEELSSLRMVEGNEKKYTRVVDDLQVKCWVGIGWVTERPAEVADYETLPVVA